MATEGHQFDALTGSGVPSSALLAYGRWWQVESYLREVAYTELRAANGLLWIDEVEAVDSRARNRVKNDQSNDYMASADADHLLAYLDTSILFELIDRRWDELFDSVLIPKIRWQGMVDTLETIRHRIAHCRRPHSDDLGRLEQALRDLEPGARRFYSAYTQTLRMELGSHDPVARAWVDREHESAKRLVEHCRANYGVRFSLTNSSRPWRSALHSTDEEGENPDRRGTLWHACWLLLDSQVNPLELWNDLPRQLQELLVHLLFDYGAVTATFSAIDPPDAVADGIGEIFDRIVTTSRPWQAEFSEAGSEVALNRWKHGWERLPSKAQVNSNLTLFDPYSPEAFTIFAA